ncbi:MAG: caspase family protein [Chitinophagaceae bacterium]|nr:caspase family protein [Chitinophagaceae bacterium]
MKMLIRPFLFIAVLFFSSKSYSLTIYEITYEFKNLTEFPKYTAMLVRYGNGTGFMRIRYSNKANTEKFVVDMQFNEVEGRSKIDGLPHLTMQFKGENPKYIVNSSKEKQEIYNPDVLWFKKESTDKNFKPWGVTSLNSDGTFEYGKILFVKVINTEDLTKAFVQNYFLPTESFYTNLFSSTSTNVASTKPPVTTNTGSTPSPPTTVATTPTKLHFVLVANTNDPRIGYSVQKDVVNITSQIKDVATFLNLPLNLVEISGTKFGKAGVETALNNLKPGTNDIVIFYYSGHGYSNDRNANEQYPQFDLRQSRFDDVLVATLNASEVLTKIKSKNARLNLVITDCCNSSLGLLKPEGKNFALTTKSLMSWEKSYCYDLFMKSKGTVIATAAKKGQYAYGNTDVGGYFTSNLIISMEKYLSKFQTSTPTWQEIIAEAQTTTVSLSLTNICTANTSCRQDPVYVVSVNK